MSNTPHALSAKFPHKRDRIHELKMSDEHFAQLADKYHDVNREIHRIEAEVEAASDMRLEDLKKERIALLDQIAEKLGD